jgi:hypothetical protein
MDQLARKVQAHGLVVWEDDAGEYREIAASVSPTMFGSRRSRAAGMSCGGGSRTRSPVTGRLRWLCTGQLRRLTTRSLKRGWLGPSSRGSWPLSYGRA